MIRTGTLFDGRGFRNHTFLRLVFQIFIVVEEPFVGLMRDIQG